MELWFNVFSCGLMFLVDHFTAYFQSRLTQFNTSVNFYRKIKSQTIEPAKVGSKTLKRSLKC
ncbi:hypothetical protein, partial [Bacteroides pyogenes]|uniref:hypothetical protein n=1 Tax=Bacteroides pyogenes TaxID=310300 RepID=UPI001C84977C